MANPPFNQKTGGTDGIGEPLERLPMSATSNASTSRLDSEYGFKTSGRLAFITANGALSGGGTMNI
jgi:hypothetical protein